MTTNDARCTRDIKPTITIAKAAFNKKILIISTLDWNLRTSLLKLLYLEHIFLWCWNFLESF